MTGFLHRRREPERLRAFPYPLASPSRVTRQWSALSTRLASLPRDGWGAEGVLRQEIIMPQCVMWPDGLVWVMRCARPRYRRMGASCVSATHLLGQRGLPSVRHHDALRLHRHFNLLEYGLPLLGGQAVERSQSHLVGVFFGALSPLAGQQREGLLGHR